MALEQKDGRGGRRRHYLIEQEGGVAIDMDSEITSFLHGSECEKEREMEVVGREGKKYICVRAG